jgi:hypothetical protein
VKVEKMLKFLIPLVAALEAADGLLTYWAVGRGIVQEANPILGNSVGSGDFLVMKVCGGLLSVCLLWLVYKRVPKFALIVSSAIVLFYAAVLTWNLGILL